MNFSEKLKGYRKEKGYTQGDFANIANFARSTISEFESGRRKPSLKTIEKIANATNTNITEWIVDEAEFEVNLFDGLKLVMEGLIASGDIDQEGKMNGNAKEKLLLMLEEEIKLLLSEKD